MLEGFRKFALRGSVIDLAVGVIIGAAFTAVVNSLVRDIITPVNRLMDLRKVEEAPETKTRECPECLSKIPTLARRCPFCTARFDSAGVPLPEGLPEGVPATLDAPVRPTDRHPG